MDLHRVNTAFKQLGPQNEAMARCRSSFGFIITLFLYILYVEQPYLLMCFHLQTTFFLLTDIFALMSHTVMPYNSAHHCVVEVENFLLLLGGEDQWNPNGTETPHTRSVLPFSRAL